MCRGQGSPTMMFDFRQSAVEAKAEMRDRWTAVLASLDNRIVNSERGAAVRMQTAQVYEQKGEGRVLIRILFT